MQTVRGRHEVAVSLLRDRRPGVPMPKKMDKGSVGEAEIRSTQPPEER